MLNDFLKDLLNAVPAFWRLIVSYDVPIKQIQTDPDFDDTLAGAFIAVVPLQLIFSLLVSSGPESRSAAVIAAFVSILAALVLVGGFSVYSGGRDRSRASIYQGWVTAIFSFWFVTNAIIIMSMTIVRVATPYRGDLLTYFMAKSFIFGWTMIPVLAFYSVLAAALIFGIASMSNRRRRQQTPDQSRQKAGLFREYVILIVGTTLLNLFNVMLLTTSV